MGVEDEAAPYDDSVDHELYELEDSYVADQLDGLEVFSASAVIVERMAERNPPPTMPVRAKDMDGNDVIVDIWPNLPSLFKGLAYDSFKNLKQLGMTSEAVTRYKEAENKYKFPPAPKS